MNAPALADAEARHRIITDTSSTLFVEAGAGSGKTSSLVARIVNLITSEVRVEEIAAITFTEAAAAELRERVRAKLDERAMACTEPSEAERFLEAAAQVEVSSFTTLHGFALRILTDYSVEAGLPPGFAVADEIESLASFDRDWRQFVGRLGDDLDLLELAMRSQALKIKTDSLRAVARLFEDNWDQLELVPTTIDPLPPLDFGPLIHKLSQLDDLRSNCVDPEDLLAKALADLFAEINELAALDPIAQLRSLAKLALGRNGTKSKWAGRLGKKGNWVGLDVGEARETASQLQQETGEAIDQLRSDVVSSYRVLVSNFVRERVGKRMAAGELAFHDLLVLSRRLAITNPEVRAQLHQRYRRILLDEFQDTDSIQIELAVLLASPADAVGRRWEDLAAQVEPGNLVVVGDPKQSIYRFRRADIKVYSETEKVLTPSVTRLTTNFRSVPGIVSWVNAFFAVEIGDGVPGSQPAYTPLTSFRSPGPDDQSPVLVIGGPEDAPVAEIRQREAADLAALVGVAVSEQWQVAERSEETNDETWRPVRLADIAILIPSRLSLPAIEAAFTAASIPIRPETSSLVYATQEVRDVLAGVRATVDPANDIDVVAALRSSLFNIGDDELLSWYTAGRSWDYRQSERPDEEPNSTPDGSTSHELERVGEAMATLARWHENRWWTEPADLVTQIVTERRLNEAALATNRPRDAWRRYRFLADQARNFGHSTGGDLHDFVQWVELQASEVARVAEPVPAEEDDDSVRILTVHGSKGLEFPMVMLAGGPTADMSPSRGYGVLFADGEMPEVSLNAGNATANYDAMAAVEGVLDKHERIRLHYVAATRARDILVVSAHHKLKGASSAGRRTWNTVTNHVDAELWRKFTDPNDDRPEVKPGSAPDHETQAARFRTELEQWGLEQQAIIARSSIPQVLSATAMAKVLTPSESAHYLPRRADAADSGLEDRKSFATAIGTAVHAVLQYVDFANPNNVAELAKIHAELESIEPLASEVAAYAEAALTAPAIRLAATSADPHWRELHVATTVRGTLIEGFVDLCLQTPDGLIIVDYKTDAVADEHEARARMQSYRHQAAVYAIALEAVSQSPVVEFRFLFLSPTGPLETPLDDLAKAREEVEHHLEELESAKGRLTQVNFGRHGSP